MPHIPTLPLHHGWAASHSTASYPSRVSSSVYSSRATPGELPVPRTSSRHSANPRAASHSPNAVSQFRRQLSFPYGIISRMTGNRSSGDPARGDGRHRLADSSSPSRTGIRTSQWTSGSYAGGPSGTISSGGVTPPRYRRAAGGYGVPSAPVK